MHALPHQPADPILAPVLDAARLLITAALEAARWSGPRGVDAIDGLTGSLADAVAELQDAVERDLEARLQQAREDHWARSGRRPDAFDRAMGGAL